MKAALKSLTETGPEAKLETRHETPYNIGMHSNFFNFYQITKCRSQNADHKTQITKYR